MLLMPMKSSFFFMETRHSFTPSEVWMSCILQHTPLLISIGLYHQLNYSLHLVTSSAFIGTVEDLECSVTLQHSIYILIQG